MKILGGILLVLVCSSCRSMRYDGMTVGVFAEHTNGGSGSMSVENSHPAHGGSASQTWDDDSDTLGAYVEFHFGPKR
jgi:hypothetical protein